MNESWRLLIDLALPGSVNMARDEAMQLLHAQGLTIPTLRLYAWKPACLSLGRFQRSTALNREACIAAGIEIVRRPSGGRALLHDDELTYAVVASSDHALVGAGSIAASYRVISLAFVEALRMLDVQTVFASKGQLEGKPLKKSSSPKTSTRESEPEPTPKEKASSACFDAPTAYELTIDGRKLIGSAQMRREQVLLQHGAVPLSAHAHRLAALLDDTPVDLAQRMIALDEAAGRRIHFEELAQALIQAFRSVWQIELEPGQWLPEELALAAQLRHEKYENDEWTYHR